MHQDFQERASDIYTYGLKLPRLEPRPFVGVECQVAHLGELYLIKRKLGLVIQTSRQVLWVKSEELNLARDLRLMGQELKLVYLHNRGKLYDDFLWVLAKLLRLPAF